MNNGEVGLGVLEKRGIKCIEFIIEFPIGIKEQVVNILCKAKPTFKFRPLVWDAAHDHVTLHKLPASHDEFSVTGIALTLIEGKWMKVYFGVDAIVKAAFVFEYFFDDPRGGTTAYYEHHVLAR